jgi:hypothetical protein
MKFRLTKFYLATKMSLLAGKVIVRNVDWSKECAFNPGKGMSLVGNKCVRGHYNTVVTWL